MFLMSIGADGALIQYTEYCLIYRRIYNLWTPEMRFRLQLRQYLAQDPKCASCIFLVEINFFLRFNNVLGYNVRT